MGGYGGYSSREKEILTGARDWAEIEREFRADARRERRNIALLMVALAALAVHMAWLCLAG